MNNAIYYTRLLENYLSDCLAPSEEQSFFIMTISGKYDNIIQSKMKELFQREAAVKDGLTAQQAILMYQNISKNFKQAFRFYKQQSPHRFARWWALFKARYN